MFLYTFVPVYRCWNMMRVEYLQARIFELTYKGFLRAGHRMV